MELVFGPVSLALLPSLRYAQGLLFVLIALGAVVRWEQVCRMLSISDMASDQSPLLVARGRRGGCQLVPVWPVAVTRSLSLPE